jgi:hypothetical protein
MNKPKIQTKQTLNLFEVIKYVVSLGYSHETLLKNLLVQDQQTFLYYDVNERIENEKDYYYYDVEFAKLIKKYYDVSEIVFLIWW